MEVDGDGDLILRRRGEELHLSEVVGEKRSCDGGSALETTLFTAVADGARHCSPLARGSRAAHPPHDSLAGAVLARVQHALATPLRSVGLQVWRGALLLADWALAHARELGSGCVALELGAGTGLAGLILARAGAGVVCCLTDAVPEVLASCAANVELNRVPPPCELLVRRLDWLDPPPWLLARDPALLSGGSDACAHAWRPEDARWLPRLQLLLAADCVYDNDLTDALMRCATALLQMSAQQQQRQSPAAAPGPSGGAGDTPAPCRLLVAVERRIAFTLRDLAPAAPALDYWRSLFREEGDSGSAPAPCRPCEEAAPCFPLLGRRLDVDALPQAVAYDRGDHLELWELRLDPEACA